MSERRSIRRDSFEAHREAKEIGPYPPWEKWKIALVSRFGDSIPEEIDKHLHEWYVLRRKRQMGQISAEEMKSLQSSFSQEHDQLFNDERAISAFRYITEKTTVKE